jgi:hypothetical protein
LLAIVAAIGCGSKEKDSIRSKDEARPVTGGAGSEAAKASPPAPPRPVNLLTAAPVVVAVSSAVANRAIVPAHLVDGDLGTAWNSRTGELQGAWIGARVPADARVTSIRMTVGFTKVDPKLGDLFTMNPRIRRVRVLRNGAPLVERALDPALRTLQEIPIDQPGGEYKIEVLDVVPGTKPTWREICVSELEVWGTLGPSTPPSPGASLPVVRVGSFDAPPAIAPDDCVAAMFPTARDDRVTLQHGPEAISNVEVIALTAELAVCRVEHTRERTERVAELSGDVVFTYADTTIELAPIARAPRLSAGERIVAATKTEALGVGEPPGSAGVGSVDQTLHTVELAVWPLTASSSALVVDVTEQKVGFHLSNSRTASTLYRVSAAGLTELLSYESSSGVDYEAGITRSERCRLVPPPLRDPAPPALTLTCEHTEEPNAGTGRRTTTSRTVRYLWRNDRYVPQ